MLWQYEGRRSACTLLPEMRCQPPVIAPIAPKVVLIYVFSWLLFGTELNIYIWVCTIVNVQFVYNGDCTTGV